MDNLPDASGQPRRPRLVLPGAGDGPSRPKIVLPGQGLIDPSSPAPEAEDAIAEIQEAESIGPATVILIQEEPVLEPNAILLNEEPGDASSPADDFLTEPSSDFLANPPQPEIQAAPAELKTIAPVRLSPPGGWVPPEFADAPDLPLQSFPQEPPADPSQVPAWQPGMAEYQPEIEASQPGEAGAFDGYDPNAQAEYAVHGTWPEPEVDPYVEPEVYPMAEPVPLAPIASPRVARSLTSPHQTRPGTHQVSLSGTSPYKTSSHGAQPRSVTAAQPHVGQTQQTHAHPHRPVAPANERLLPGWVFVSIGVLLGVIGGIAAVARTPLGEKIGLISRTESAAYAIALIKEERSQVQSMLDTYHERAKINLAEEMAEFRTEMGRKLPERMTLDEFRQAAKPDSAGEAKTDKPAEAEKPANADKPDGEVADPKAAAPVK